MDWSMEKVADSLDKIMRENAEAAAPGDFPTYGQDSYRNKPTWPGRRSAKVAGRGDAGARAKSASERKLHRPLHRAGIHCALSDHRPAGFRASRDRLSARPLARRIEVPKALSHVVSQSWRVP